MAGSRVMMLASLALCLVLAYWIFSSRREPGVAAAEPLSAYTEFALDFARRVGLGEGNTAVSPLSVYVALLTLTEGAGGDTRAELLAALRLQSMGGARSRFKEVLRDVMRVEEPARISVANSAWAQSGYPLSGSYLDVLREYYSVEVRLVDFEEDPGGSAELINGWVRSKTHGLIDRILEPSSIDRLTRLVLVNTVYFRGNWTSPFEEVAAGVFHAPGGDVAVSYMRGRMSLRLLEEGEYTAVMLGYRGVGIKFIVLMPGSGDLRGFLRGLDEGELLGILDRLLSSEPVTVELYLPKFDVDSGVVSLREVLWEMGVRAAFDPLRADLSLMLEGGRRELYVRDVLHRARVRADLWGTEAAAATAVAVPVTAAPPQKLRTVRIDRPFLFLLVEPGSRTIIFAGSLVKP